MWPLQNTGCLLFINLLALADGCKSAILLDINVWFKKGDNISLLVTMVVINNEQLMLGYWTFVIYKYGSESYSYITHNVKKQVVKEQDWEYKVVAVVEICKLTNWNWWVSTIFLYHISTCSCGRGWYKHAKKDLMVTYTVTWYY